MQSIAAALVIGGIGWLGYALVLSAPAPVTAAIAIGHDATASALGNDPCAELGRLAASALARSGGNATLIAMRTGRSAGGYAPERLGALQVEPRRSVLEHAPERDENTDDAVLPETARRRIESWCANTEPQTGGRSAVVGLIQALARSLTDCSVRPCVLAVRTDGFDTQHPAVAQALRTGRIDQLEPIIDNEYISARICGISNRAVRGTRRAPSVTRTATVLRRLFTNPSTVEISDFCEHSGGAQ